MSFWNWNFISHFRIIPINLFSFHSNIRLGLIFLFDILFPKPYLHLDVRDFQNDVCFLQFDERNFNSIFFGLGRGLVAKSERGEDPGILREKAKNTSRLYLMDPCTYVRATCFLSKTRFRSNQLRMYGAKLFFLRDTNLNRICSRYSTAPKCKI